MFLIFAERQMAKVLAFPKSDFNVTGLMHRLCISQPLARLQVNESALAVDVVESDVGPINKAALHVALTVAAFLVEDEVPTLCLTSMCLIVVLQDPIPKNRKISLLSSINSLLL